MLCVIVGINLMSECYVLLMGHEFFYVLLLHINNYYHVLMLHLNVASL